MISITEKDSDKILKYLRDELNEINDEIENMSMLLNDKKATNDVAKVITDGTSTEITKEFENSLFTSIQNDYNIAIELRDKLVGFIEILTIGSVDNE